MLWIDAKVKRSLNDAFIVKAHGILTSHRSVNGIGAYLAYHGHILLKTVSNQSVYDIRVTEMQTYEELPAIFSVKLFLQTNLLTFSINKVSQNSIN